MQSFDVPGDADEVPLSVYCCASTQRKPVESHNRLNHSECWLHSTLAYRIDCFAGSRFQSMLHSRHCIGIVRQRLRFNESLPVVLQIKLAYQF
jgi:hypothetical protein